MSALLLVVALAVHPEAEAAWQLALEPDRAAVPKLLALLDHEDAQVRFAASMALSRVPTDPTLRQFAIDGNLAAVRALAMSGSDEAIKPLRRALARAPKSKRPDLIREIGRFGPPAIPLLMKQLGRVECHRAVADALYRIGPWAERALDKHLGGSKRVRDGVRMARSRFREDRPKRPTYVSNALRQLKKAMADIERQRKPNGALPDITLRDKEWTVPEAVALANHAAQTEPRDEVIPVFMRMTRDRDPRLVAAGVLGLGKVRYLSAQGRFEELAGPSHKREVRVAALWGIARVGADTESVRAILRQAAVDADARVRQGGAAALWALGEKGNADAVRAALRDSIWAWGIEELADKFGIEFVDALRPYPKALVKLGKPVVPKLIDYLREGEHVREALAALTEFGFGTDAVAAVDMVLAISIRPEHERAAFATLNEIATEEALRKALFADDVQIRYQAARALGIF